MPVIQKPALRDLYQRVAAQGGSAKVDAATLDRIVGIVGDASDAQLSGLTREQKLAVAQKGLDAQEKADLTALLGDASFASKLDPAAANFLKAIVGIEALQGVDTLSTASTTSGGNTVEQQASARLRDLIKSGELSKWYDAVIGATNNPALKAEAEALFAKLPVVKPGMTGTDFVKAGLWTVAPRGIDEMHKSARYLPGRQVLVETTLYAKIPAPRDPSYERERRKIGTFDPTGPKAVTYRATLVGEDPTNAQNFLVKVDGNDKPVSVTKASVVAQNQPFVLSDQHVKSDVKRDLPFGVWGTWNVDFSTPLARAKLCEMAIEMDQYVKQLDFSKQKTTPSGGAIGAVFGRGEVAKKMVELQKACVETVFDAIDMKYPKDDGTRFTDAGRVHNDVRDVARQAVRGTGMCVQQSTVFGALLTPFMDVLGIDAQFRFGGCFRNINHATDNVFSSTFGSPHGWWQLTFRPSMEMTVTDRTWDQVNLTLDLAYGFPYGDRYANKNIDGFTPQKLADTDINVSGEVSVQTFERQFSQVGHGRENHISRHNRDG